MLLTMTVSLAVSALLVWLLVSQTVACQTKSSRQAAHSVKVTVDKLTVNHLISLVLFIFAIVNKR